MNLNQSSKEKPDNTGKNNSNKPKFNFNFYWIYAIIAVVFFAMQFVNWGSGAKLSNWENFETNMLREQDVDRIVVVNNEQVEIYIKSEKLNQEKYRAVQDNGIGKFNNSGPHYYFPISSVEYFLNELKEAQEDYPTDFKKLHAESETRKNWGGEILGWLLPIILMIALWVFIMKRMGSGSGGAAGNIFNIGKSKAALFDAKNHINISFKDVASLEEAKEEIEIGRAHV